MRPLVGCTHGACASPAERRATRRQYHGAEDQSSLKIMHFHLQCLLDWPAYINDQFPLGTSEAYTWPAGSQRSPTRRWALHRAFFLLRASSPFIDAGFL